MLYFGYVQGLVNGVGLMFQGDGYTMYYLLKQYYSLMITIPESVTCYGQCTEWGTVEKNSVIKQDT